VRRIPYRTDILRPWASAAVLLLLIASIRTGDALSHEWGDLLFSLGAIFFIVIGGFGLNDLFDYRLDAIVHPERAIPSGRVKPKTIASFSIIALSIGVGILFSLGIPHGTLGVISAGLLILYGPAKNFNGILGNFLISLLFVLVVVYGSYLTNSFEIRLSAVILSLGVFLASMSQEIVKDIEDIEGDRGFRRTLPMQIGLQNAFAVSGILMALSLVSFITYLLLGVNYIFIISAPVTGVYGAITVIKLMSATTDQATSRVRLIKLGMSFVLLVMVVGG
jgi:geranylgeranylglycerol-phosphate geranylgeranyltransferase